MTKSQTKQTILTALSKEDIINQLKYLGVGPKMTVEVHTSFSKIGMVIGGASALVDALIEIVGEEGNIVMSSQDCYNTEPLFWENPPIDVRLAKKIRENTPGYDIYTSGLHQMGIVADELRSRKNTYHSYHPNCAFMAYGKDAKQLMQGQPLSFPFGLKSPLGKMYEMQNCYILLIGVDYDNATGMHLGEYLSNTRNIVLQGGSVKKAGESIWRKYLDYDIDSDDFLAVGQQMENQQLVNIARVGDAVCKLFPFKTAVDYTCNYLVQENK